MRPIWRRQIICMGEMSRLLVLQRVLHVATTGLSTDANYKENFGDAVAQPLISRCVTAEVGSRSQATPNWDLWCIKVAPDGFLSKYFSFFYSLLHFSPTLYNLSNDRMVTRTFVISIKSNKEGTGFAKDLLIVKTPVLKHVCYMEEQYSVTAGVLKYLPIWRSVCISVYQIQFLLNEYFRNSEI